MHVEQKIWKISAHARRRRWWAETCRASGVLGISAVLAYFRASGTYDVYSKRLKSRARVDRGQLLSCRTVRRSGPAAESSDIAWRLAATSSTVMGSSIPHCGSLMGYTGRVSGALGLENNRPQNASCFFDTAGAAVSESYRQCPFIKTTWAHRFLSALNSS